MHHTRIAVFLLGAWLFGSLSIAYVATQNFDAVDQVMKNPPPAAAKMIQTLGDDNARHLLRHLAGEENRSYFETWELAQLFIGVALIVVLLLGIENRILA